MKLKQLRDERGELLEAMSAIDAKASEEQRSLTADEQKEWDNAEARINDLNKQIERAEKAEKINAQLAASAGERTSNETSEDKEIKQFSFLRFVKQAANKNLEGFEKEMHEEAEKEAREVGYSIKNYGIPSSILTARTFTRNSVTGGVQPADGGQLVKDDQGGMIDYLRDAQILRQAGARYLTGLKGNIPFDQVTQVATSTWKAENAVLDASKQQYANKEMTPHRLGTIMSPSKQLLVQASYDVEQMFRQDLLQSIAQAVDAAGIKGSGAANEPLGVLNTAGIGSVAIGSLGGDPTYAHILGLEREVDIKNALEGNLRFLLNAKVRAKLRNTKIDAGSGQFLMPNKNELVGYNALSSNAVPSDLTKTDGTSTATDLSAIIFGNFQDLLIGQWGGLDVLADPYTLAGEGKLRLIVDSFWDVLVRRAESFAAIKDAKTTL
jgi:HK97 family phage major capsid protein